jgi:hypothetical protein
MSERPKVLVCGGRHCSKEGKARQALIEVLQPVADIEEVGCQKICQGPVAGLEVGGQLEWYCELDRGKRRRRLVELVETGEVPKKLLRRWVEKRSGQKR